MKTPAFVLTTPEKRDASPSLPTLGMRRGTLPASNTNSSLVPRELSSNAPELPLGSSAVAKPAALVLGSAPSASAAVATSGHGLRAAAVVRTPGLTEKRSANAILSEPVLVQSEPRGP